MLFSSIINIHGHRIKANRIKFKKKINKYSTQVTEISFPRYKFNNLHPSHEKINFIDHIVWINLDKSKDRYIKTNNMLNLLSSIPNTRIEAINGEENSFIDSCKLLNIAMSPKEIACSLSHIKAIETLKRINGEFFMVCEDDISFENLRFFDITLFDIIKNAPYFDVLMVYHSYPTELFNEYVDWNSHAQLSKNRNQIAGAVAYIIRKSCVQSFPNFDINSIPIDFDLADRYIFKKVKTIVYKYNFITSTCNNSTIHENHLSMHKEWKNNHMLIIQRNLATLNRKYKSCKIYIHYNAQQFPELIQKICQNFKDSNIAINKSDADIIIFHELDDPAFEPNQKYNILIQESFITSNPYNFIIDSNALDITIPANKFTDFFISN